MQRSVVWNENQQPGDIIRLAADDYDSQENGPPFTYRIAPDASLDIQDKFSIKGTDTLYAKVYFDREEQKYYDVPIAITDSGSPPQTGISYIRVIIGDLNDNPAQDNSFSEIFIYSYQVSYKMLSLFLVITFTFGIQKFSSDNCQELSDSIKLPKIP